MLLCYLKGHCGVFDHQRDKAAVVEPATRLNEGRGRSGSTNKAVNQKTEHKSK